MYGNPVHFISPQVLEGINIFSIVTDSKGHKLCCFKSSRHTKCNASPTWPNSCTRLLGNEPAVILMWLVSVCGIGLNMLSYILNGIGDSKLASEASYNYRLTVTFMSFGDCLCCAGLLII